jgi:hypothetical protein
MRRISLDRQPIATWVGCFGLQEAVDISFLVGHKVSEFLFAKLIKRSSSLRSSKESKILYLLFYIMASSKSGFVGDHCKDKILLVN